MSLLQRGRCGRCAMWRHCVHVISKRAVSRTALHSPACPVEYMSAKRMFLGYPWMIEITLYVAGHAYLLHHPPRRKVVDGSEGDNFANAQS